MKGQGQSRKLLFCLVALVLLLGMSGCSSVQTNNAAQQPAGVPEKTVEAPQPAVAPQQVFVTAPYFPAPSSIDLCGEPVPLQVEEVYERFDREFTLVVYNHAQVYLWLKRMERYFPFIEEKLRQYNLPDDLKWVAIAESDLQPTAVSPKGAAGPWQFMSSTGAAYGLDQRGSVDRRYDFERATESAFLFLNDLYQRYRNWALAIAAYNCGGGRVNESQRSQGVTDYYRLKLPLETERYVMRIIAIKAVLSNPSQYGYDLPKGCGYGELKLDCVRVSLPRSVPIQTLAGSAGISYREFKRLNPVFRADDVPAGNHEVKLPEGCGKGFEQNCKVGFIQTASSAPAAAQREDTPVPAAASARPEAPKAQPKAAEPVKAQKKPVEKTYTVKKGDTLSGIAQRFDTTGQALKNANKLKSADLQPGQKLRIP